MCGRFTLTTPAELVAEAFGLSEVPPLAPRYNIAPTQDVAVVRPDDTGRRLDLLRWGLIVAGAAGGAPLINARAESLASRPAFREAFARRRCLIPADGFYEWRRIGRAREPFHIRRADAAPIAFAGLWALGSATEPRGSCVIVTTDANDTVKKVHDRMPVILDPADYALWLDPAESRAERLGPLLRPAGDMLVAVSVGPTVNDARHEGPACLMPAPTLL